MKQITLILITLFIYTLSDAQIRVVTNGDVLIDNTSITNTTADLDIPTHHNNRNNFQAGSFGIQSLSTNNGFLTHNSYFDIANGGNQMVLRTAAAGAMAQFFNGRIIFRTILTGPAGSARAFTTGFVVQNNGNMQVGYPWTQPQTAKLAVNGNISALGTVYPSDRALKKNVKEFETGLDAVMNLETISYQYNGNAGIDDESTHIGLYAQDLQKVAPEMVEEFTYQPVKVTSDIEGKFSNVGAEETYLQIKDSEIKYLLLNAIQEQQAIIEAQNDRIEKLEAAINNPSSTTVLSNGSSITISDDNRAQLNENRPNPFNGYTEIDYVIPTNAKSAALQIFNMNGKLIKNVSIDHVGEGTLKVNAEDLPSGVYSYSLIVDGSTLITKKMTSVK